MWPWSRLKKLELENWQMREALGYPMPSYLADKYPGQFANGGSNPFKCGVCDARRKHPDFHKSTD